MTKRMTKTLEAQLNAFISQIKGVHNARSKQEDVVKEEALAKQEWGITKRFLAEINELSEKNRTNWLSELKKQVPTLEV